MLPDTAAGSMMQCATSFGNVNLVELFFSQLALTKIR